MTKIETRTEPQQYHNYLHRDRKYYLNVMKIKNNDIAYIEICLQILRLGCIY